ncbi:MAG TPA: leucyl aminopeptidase [Alphaproteobacteria bacterium]|jgi:leucyl aminopeptidase|nr:leucyl aminopeptidase [Alphaproteobacteria bacterium]
MKITFDAKPPKSDALVVFAAEDGKGDAKLLTAGADTDKKTKGAIKRAIAAAKFQGKKAQSLGLPGLQGVSEDHVIIIGLGKVEDLKAQDFNKLGSSLVPLLNARKVAAAAVAFPDAKELKLGKALTLEEAAARFAQAAYLNTYRFDKYLTKEPKEKKPTLKSMAIVVEDVPKMRKVFSRYQKVAEGAFLTRDLVSEVPNVLYPDSFAKIIKKELSPLGVDVQILTRKEMEKHKMGALIAVGQGSVREPRLVTMRYNGGKKGQKPIAFVGKGITFDTGGISLKPGAGMEEMKWDMGGAGTVTGLMKALAARGAKVNVIGIVALAENMPDGNAYRPGDIITSMSGQTIEVHNTDAEGRLVLSDALWYVQEKFKPTHIIDLATLTGAMIIALGHEYAGVFSNDDDLPKQLMAAGKETEELVWHMPLHDAWDKAIDSPAADMKNIGGRDAGSATAAHFLKRFIQNGTKWAHLDIAGVAWSSKDRTGVPKGASSFGVRLLDQYVADVWEK